MEAGNLGYICKYDDRNTDIWKKDTLFPGGMGVSCPWLYLSRGWSNAVPTFVIRHPTYLDITVSNTLTKTTPE
jgi:hypothetical protein